MAKKSDKKMLGVFKRRSYEPLKMTVAVSAAGAVILVLFAVMIVSKYHY